MIEVIIYHLEVAVYRLLYDVLNWVLELLKNQLQLLTLLSGGRTQVLINKRHPQAVLPSLEGKLGSVTILPKIKGLSEVLMTLKQYIFPIHLGLVAVSDEIYFGLVDERLF